MPIADPFQRFRLFLGAVALALPLAAAAATPAGRIQFVIGEAVIIGPAGQSRQATKGDPVHEGDTIETRQSASVHLRMSDDGIVALRPETRLTIDRFRWEGREDGTESSILSLLKGGFRTITGVIGRRNRDNYLVRTHTATIGIRGTDHEPYYIPAPAAGETPQAAPGAYNKVNVGQTYIRSEAGTLELGANEVGYASLQAGIAPVRLERVPDFMRRVPAPRGDPDRRELRDSAMAALREWFEQRLAAMSFEERRRLFYHLLATDRIALASFVLASSLDLRNPGASSGGPIVAPVGFAAVGGLLGEAGQAASGGAVITPERSTLILLDANRNPSLIADSGGFRFSRDGAPLADSGSASLNGSPVQWGVYAGGTIFDADLGTRHLQFFHFMGSPDVTPPAALAVPGFAQYSTTVGFTRPVDELGRIGGTAGLTARVVFGAAPRLTLYQLSVSDAGGRNWQGSLNVPSQPLADFARAQASPNLNVTCSGACAPTGTGSATGFVIGGASRDGLISSYDLRAGPRGVTGSIAVK